MPQSPKRPTAWERGQGAALIATVTPVLMVGAILLFDFGRLLDAQRWGQSVVDSAAVTAAMQINEFEIGRDQGNQVLIDLSYHAVACRAIDTQNAIGGGVGFASSVPQISGCSATLTGERRVRVTAVVNAGPMFLLGQLVGAGNTISVPVSAEAQFRFGIVDELTR